MWAICCDLRAEIHDGEVENPRIPLAYGTRGASQHQRTSRPKVCAYRNSASERMIWLKHWVRDVKTATICLLRAELGIFGDLKFAIQTTFESSAGGNRNGGNLHLRQSR